MALMLARCAVVAGVQALFIETHLDPANARSDAQSMLTLEQAVDVLVQVVKLRDAMS
jgi:2-dehydro-3-deoxyphosphooctonate aldolase (KDO 8-P synthase)